MRGASLRNRPSGLRRGTGATAAALVLLAGLWAWLAPAAPAAAPARFPDVSAGQQLILQKGCANCHGVLGPGGRQGPDLLRTARGKGTADLLADMWNHIPQMVAALLAGERLPSLSSTELRDLVGYLNFVNYLGDPGDPQRGGAQLAEMPCLACHDLQQRGKIGPALVVPERAASPVGLVTDLWNHYPSMRAALREQGLPWFQWSGDFISNVSCYLSSLVPAGTHAPLLPPGEAAAGSRVFARLGCEACHDRSGGAAWAALARRSNRLSAAENGAALLRHLPVIDRAAGRTRAELRPLSERDMADLLAYLSLAGTELPGGDPSKGRAVFERKQCAGCHALPGRKPGIGPDVQDMPAAGDPFQVAALMIQHARNMKTATELKHVPWPQMEADDLLDLWAFLSTEGRR